MSDEQRHEPGCECLEFGCGAIRRSHGCYCDVPADASPDPTTEPEGFRAYQAGFKAGRADERTKLAKLARRILDGDTAAFVELATILDDAL